MWSLLRRMSSHILSIFGRGVGGGGRDSPVGSRTRAVSVHV